MARIYLAADRAAFFAAHPAAIPAGGSPTAPSPRGCEVGAEEARDPQRGRNPRGSECGEAGAGADFPLSETTSLAIRFGATLVHVFRERVDQESEEVNVIAMLNSLDLLVHLMGKPFLALALPTLSSLLLVILDYNVSTVPRFHSRSPLSSDTSTTKRFGPCPIARPASSPPSLSSRPSSSTEPTFPTFPPFPLFGGYQLDIGFSLSEFQWNRWKLWSQWSQWSQWSLGFHGFPSFSASGLGAAAAADPIAVGSLPAVSFAADGREFPLCVSSPCRHDAPRAGRRRALPRPGPFNRAARVSAEYQRAMSRRELPRPRLALPDFPRGFRGEAG